MTQSFTFQIREHVLSVSAQDARDRLCFARTIHNEPINTGYRMKASTYTMF